MNHQIIYSASFFLIALLMGFAYYLQIYDGFLPCPLCSLQRVVFSFLAILFFAGTLFARHGFMRFLINSLLVVGALLGILFAGRQVWLQHFPPLDGAQCGISLQYMLKVLPLKEVLQKVFAGGAECSQKDWLFLHLSMAEWSLIVFIFFLGLAIYLWKTTWQKH